MPKHAEGDRLTLASLEVLLWGAACGRVATGALALTGLIAFAGFSDPEAGLVALLFLSPITIGISVVFGLFMIGATVRGFRLLFLGRGEHGPLHKGAAVRATVLFAASAAVGLFSLILGAAQLSTVGALGAPSRGTSVSMGPLLSAYVLSDAFAIIAAALAAIAVLQATRHLAPPGVGRQGAFLVALAVSYPAASFTIEARMLADGAVVSPSSLLLLLAVPIFAVGAYLALRLAASLLEEARLFVVTSGATQFDGPAEPTSV